MKIFHKFFINRFFNILIGGALLAPPLSYAKDTSFPGIIESLETLIDIDSARLKKKADEIAKNQKFSIDVNSLKSVEIDHDFLESILFHSDKRLIPLINENPCGLYALLDTQLLKSHLGKIVDVYIQYEKDGNKKFAAIPKDDFLDIIYKNNCQDNRKIKNQYGPAGIANSISKLKIKEPKLETDCSLIISDWRKNPETPFVCDAMETLQNQEKAQATLMSGNIGNEFTKQELIEKIQQGQKLNNQLSQGSIAYFKNLCSNIGSHQSFCNSYFNQSYWSKVLAGQGIKEDLHERCKTIFNKKELSTFDLNLCVRKLHEQPETCHYDNQTTSNSLVPKPNCNNLSKALNISRLKRDYQDCPYQTGDEGIVNLARIFFHYSDEGHKQYVLKNLECFLPATAFFAKINVDYEAMNAWGNSVCFDDKINAKEVCLPVIFGSHPNSDFSEEKQVFTILSKTKGADKSTPCKVVSTTNYNPTLLEYKYGCFLIYNPQTCFGNYCPKKIILNEREVTHIKYKYSNSYDYFPNSVAKEKYASISLIENQLKASSNKITSVTSLRYFFSQNANYIVHGIGCAEDLLPSFFQKTTINQCRPLTFIVDGLIEKNGRASLVVRTALDELKSPRIIDWNHVFSSVASFQVYHPMRLWGLYVLKK